MDLSSIKALKSDVPGGTLEAWRYTELGDITAWTRLRLLGKSSEQTRLTAGLGLILPTGTTRVRNSEGTLAEPSLQPGSGGFGLLTELSFRGVLGLPFASSRQPSLWYASARLKLNLSGDEGYRFGHEAAGHAGMKGGTSRTFGRPVAVWLLPVTAVPTCQRRADHLGSQPADWPRIQHPLAIVGSGA